MKLVFLGTSGCIPDIGDDTASMLIDDKYLVDVGWDVVRNLRNKGVDPISVNTVFFTHMPASITPRCMVVVPVEV